MDFFGLLNEVKGIVTFISLANAATGHKDNSISEDIPNYLEEFMSSSHYMDIGKKR